MPQPPRSTGHLDNCCCGECKLMEVSPQPIPLRTFRHVSEVEAMGIMAEALDGLDHKARVRVLQWAMKRVQDQQVTA